MTLNCHRGLRSQKSQSQNLSLQESQTTITFSSKCREQSASSAKASLASRGTPDLQLSFCTGFLKAGELWHMDSSQRWYTDMQASPNTSQLHATSCAPWMETLAEVKPFCTLVVLSSQNGSDWKATASLKQCYCSTQTWLGALLEKTTGSSPTQIYQLSITKEMQISHYMQISHALHKCS